MVKKFSTNPTSEVSQCGLSSVDRPLVQLGGKPTCVVILTAVGCMNGSKTLGLKHLAIFHCQLSSIENIQLSFSFEAVIDIWPLLTAEKHIQRALSKILYI